MAIQVSKEKAAKLHIEILKSDKELNETKLKILQKNKEENNNHTVSAIIGIFILIMLVGTSIYLLQKKQKKIRKLEEKLAQIEKLKHSDDSKV